MDVGVEEDGFLEACFRLQPTTLPTFKSDRPS